MKILNRLLDRLINTNEIEEDSSFKEVVKECESETDLKVLEILTIIQNNISI
ncbi:hypothetical protein RBU49_09855 [Clostridium sp. MB40-C1]|uniref:hypothetical protein n=1 Tax=Clostridium sp. MB40-C1 TaxID=3070996 RepID=UPI0027DF98DD|nr:hypothetical protein [Clostridium sp. MB40-C1]WMJ79193.1 hypothetical protein RBU49_09855 [Clostridium sp. MB40-C1]